MYHCHAAYRLTGKCNIGRPQGDGSAEELDKKNYAPDRRTHGRGVDAPTPRARGTASRGVIDKKGNQALSNPFRPS